MLNICFCSHVLRNTLLELVTGVFALSVPLKGCAWLLQFHFFSTAWGCKLVLEGRGCLRRQVQVDPSACCLWLQSAKSCYFCNQSWAASTKANKSIPAESWCVTRFFRSDLHPMSSIFLLALLEHVLSCCNHLTTSHSLFGIMRLFKI